MGYYLNGRPHGEDAQVLNSVREVGLLRPWLDEKGRPCVTVNTGRIVERKDRSGKIVCNEHGDPLLVPEKQNLFVYEAQSRGWRSPVFNATVLRKEEWIYLDEVVVKEARKRLRAWADLSAANSLSGFNGMANPILEHETMNDPGEAIVDMDGLTDDRADETQYQLEGMPLPITHSGFPLSERFLEASRNKGMGLDSIQIEWATRRVVEKVEKTTIGNETGIKYGGRNSLTYGRTPQVYGYTNFPQRLTSNSLTAPLSSDGSLNGSWAPSDTLSEVLGLLDTLKAQNFFGPFMIYHTSDWDRFMDNDYILTGGNVATQTLRNRLRQNDDVQDVKRLDFWTDRCSLLVVQMTSDVARAVNGMDMRTVQWPSKGGAQINIRVMCIYAPQLRATFSGRCGILHATPSA